MEGQSPSKKARTNPKWQHKKTAEGLPSAVFTLYYFFFFLPSTTATTATASAPRHTLNTSLHTYPHPITHIVSPTICPRHANIISRTSFPHYHPHHRHTAPSPRANIMQTASHSSRSLMHTFSRLIPLTAQRHLFLPPPLPHSASLTIPPSHLTPCRTDNAIQMRARQGVESKKDLC